MFNPLTERCTVKRNIDEVLGEYSGESSGGIVTKKRTYHRPDSEAKINELKHKNFAFQSKKKIRWCVNMYDDWRRERMLDPYIPREICSANLNALFTFSEGDLDYSLARFIREVKKVDGTDFPPNSLREIIIMIQMYLHENLISWKLLDGDNFSVLRNMVDNTMKERTAQGLGVRRSS